MAWTKVPKENEELLARMMESVPEADKRKMFGCPAYFINGNMFAGAHQDSIILRLSESDQEKILKNEGVTNFTPMPGRAMREYVALPASIYRSPKEFGAWIEKSRKYVGAMPPKEKKSK